MHHTRIGRHILLELRYQLECSVFLCLGIRGVLVNEDLTVLVDYVHLLWVCKVRTSGLDVQLGKVSRDQ